ncbi:MAG: hypothetical protein M1326_05995 [Cyanobacteria bacterium]|nr:hypothetical protein [Cyanobacteriota bacterium]
MFKIIFLFLTIIFIYLSVSPPLFASANNKLEIHFFYSEDCGNCNSILEKINNLIDNHKEKVSIKTYEISKNDSNLNLLFYVMEKLNYNYNSKNIQVPVIFIENNILIGKSDFDKNFERVLNEQINQKNHQNMVSEIIADYFKKQQNKSFLGNKYITFPAVMVSALIDSVNPCAIAVIIFLISTLIINLDRNKIFLYGLIYIITIFIVYLSLGFCLIYFVKKINIPHLFFIIIGSILIILGLLSFKDFFIYGKGFSLKIPDKIKTFITGNIYKATIFSIILAGLVVSIFETACSGAIYLGIISLISQVGLNSRLFLLLIVYNFIFIIPLLLILMIFYFGFPLKRISRLFIQKRKRLYKLVIGIILILLGVYLIVFFI